jgi:AraC-like DNA-binding protein
MADAYREREPAAALRELVACVWTGVTRAPDDPRGRVLPDGCVDVVWMPGGEPFVAGPDTGPKPEGVGGRRVVGIRFRPGAAPSLLGVPAAALTDERPALRDVWRRGEVRALEEELARARCVEAAMASLEAAVQRRLAVAREPDPGVRELVRGIEERVRPGLRGARSVAAPVGERQLRRRFVAAVGYGPKTFERIARFQRFLRLARAPGPRRPGLAELAARAGYADQAHLGRECQRLAGLPPRQLLDAPAPRSMSDPFKTRARISPSLPA